MPNHKYYNPIQFHRRADPASKKFFNRCPWKDWWEEFLTDRRDDGRMHYLTSHEFAQEKAKSLRELRLIYKAIGPKPVNLKAFVGQPHNKGSKIAVLEVPYLGDWQQIRAQAYFYDDKSLESMKQVVAERLDSLEAGRGSATLVLDMLAKYMRYDASIDDAFGNEPVVAGINPLKQKARAEFFFSLKEKTLKGSMELIHAYLACHGINSDGVNDLARLIIAVGKNSANAALAGVVTGAGITSADDSRAGHLLTQAIIQKDRIFKLGLPTAVLDMKPEEALNFDGRETEIKLTKDDKH